MKVLIRSTTNGNEYWDNIAKKTIFVPAGVEPPFEVTENPETMIADKVVVSKVIVPLDLNPNLESMNNEQLRAFAEQNNIELPANIKKDESIRKFITNQLAKAADAQ